MFNYYVRHREPMALGLGLPPQRVAFSAVRGAGKVDVGCVRSSALCDVGVEAYPFLGAVFDCRALRR